MALGLVGIKRGMTRVYMADGASIPVTVVEAQPHRVVAIRDVERHGYQAVQLTWGSRAPQRLNKPMQGLYKKAGEVAPGVGLREFRPAATEAMPKVGSQYTVELFQEGQRVDVGGTTRGRGFSGVIRRHSFSRGDASHGCSKAHRTAGSIGQCQTPGRVMKGKKMAGHYGDAWRTVQSLEVVRVDVKRNLLLLRGAVPGARGGRVVLQPAVKRRDRRTTAGE